MHRVGDRIEEIDHAEKRDEAPALQARVEREIHNDGRGKDADHEPRLELAVARAGALDDVAHDGVVERVEHTRADMIAVTAPSCAAVRWRVNRIYVKMKLVNRL